jgi:hypothetical protein
VLIITLGLVNQPDPGAFLIDMRDGGIHMSAPSAENSQRKIYLARSTKKTLTQSALTL